MKAAISLSAYYAMPETTIRAYFKACGITGDSPARLACSLRLGRIAAEDTKSKKTQKRIREWVDAYDEWNKKVKFSSRQGARPPHSAATWYLARRRVLGQWSYQPRGASPDD